jgi:PleD family two-component response regulator
MPITFSAGIADTTELARDDMRPRALIALADKRLDTAQTAGKDRLVSD